MKKTKMEKGITLIALIITIVVLLILAAVAINSIQDDGLIQYAQNATGTWNQVEKNEQGILGGYEELLENGGSYIAKIVDANGKDFKNTKVEKNTTVYDKYGNKIVIPAGFKIRIDETTNNADTVTEGIVIEDGTNGNQFVWIPVGTIYTSVDKSTSETITLGRYSNFTATNGAYTPAQTAENYATATTINSYYTEDISSSKNNAEARNLEAFITSVIGNDEKEGNGGYYIGRYEAGDSDSETVVERTKIEGASTPGTLVCKANQVPYNYIFQPDASSKCQSMYPDGYKADGTGTFSSDLVNSYAWDTAIIFIQTFGTKSNSKTYASTIGKSSIDTTAPQLTGVNRLAKVTNNPIDEQLNIYDMAGNCREWSTETYSNTYRPCVYRGGSFGSSNNYTSYRMNDGTTFSYSNPAFRPLIYVAL